MYRKVSGPARFRHVCVPVRDLRKLVGFYRDVMGFLPVKRTLPERAHLKRVFGADGLRLEYVKMRMPGQPRGSAPLFEMHRWRSRRRPLGGRTSHIALTVTGLDRWYRKLAKGGVRFLGKPVFSPDGTTRVCFCFDPEGNLIELFEEVRRKRRCAR